MLSVSQVKRALFWERDNFHSVEGRLVVSVFTETAS